jgi:hypothetical protein
VARVDDRRDSRGNIRSKFWSRFHSTVVARGVRASQDTVIIVSVTHNHPDDMAARIAQFSVP